MKKQTLMTLIFLSLCFTQLAFGNVSLSENVFRSVPFSSQYSEDGALIRSVDFRSVNDLIPQLEEVFAEKLNGQSLQDRNESHITVITPPEGKSDFFPGNIGIDQVLPTMDMIRKYKPTLQNTEFDIVCVGMQTNPKGNIVFYLVVESNDIMDIRNEISDLVKQQNAEIPFNPAKYYPHITIGYVGGDVHGVSKGPETCVADVDIF